MDKRWVKFPEVLFFQEGPGVRNTQYTFEGVKLLNVANLVNGKVDISNSDRFISRDEAYSKYKHFLCDNGDFIVASSGIKVEYIDKKMGFIDESMLPLCMNTSTIRFKVLNSKELNIRYFMYYLKSRHFKLQLAKQITGSAQLNYGPSHLKDMCIPIVDICIQNNIVEILDKIQNIINIYEAKIEKLDILVRARFVEMFGDPVKNTKGWKVKRLGELSIQINSGNTPKGGSSVYVDEGIAFFRSQNVWKDRLEMEDIVYISNDTHASMKRSSLKNGDILMTKTGRINTENSSLGRAALYVGEDDKANVNGHVYFIRLKPEVNNKFILRILVSVEYRDLIRSVCVGGIDKRQLNKEHIENFPIICPPDGLIDKYIELVDHIDKSKFEVQKALDKAQLLFDSLMQKYFG